MGLLQMPNQRSYWDGDMTYTGCSSVLSCNRFEKLFHPIHFVENHEIDENVRNRDRLWKFRPWLAQLRENCFYAFLSRTMTTHAESINSDLQRGLDRR